MSLKNQPPTLTPDVPPPLGQFQAHAPEADPELVNDADILPATWPLDSCRDPAPCPPPLPSKVGAGVTAATRDLATDSRPVPPPPEPLAPAVPGPFTGEDVDEGLSLAAGVPAVAEAPFDGAPAPSPVVVGEKQVVIHSCEGQTLRGSLRDVNLEGPTLPLETRGGTVRLAVDRMRAVFFVVPIGEPLPEPRGRKVRVVFEDGRQVTGLVEGHSVTDSGFFLVPTESRGRTERIYVYRKATREVGFL